MAATVTRAESRTTSIGKAKWRALAASWLGWMFDGYETYALVLVMTPALHQLLAPDRLPLVVCVHVDPTVCRNTPTKANIVVFSNEKGTILYAGLIADWPKVISSDAEWGEVTEMDATKEPFAGKRAKFFSLQQILNYIGCSLLQTAHLPNTPQCVFGRPM